MTPQDRKRIVTEALSRLAVATREKLERQTLQVYDEALTPWRTETIVAACRRLQTTATWFPKVAEIVETCRTVTREREIREDSRRLKAADFVPVPREKVEQFMADIRKAIHRHDLAAPRGFNEGEDR